MNQYKQNKTTIAQVAAEAHVSMTTVSRYLNGKYNYMSAATRERIQNVIERMHYQPSNIARSLKSQKSKTIACVLADIGSTFSSILLKGVNHVCDEQGYQVLFSSVDNSPEKEINAIQAFLASQVDGLIVNTTGCNDDFLIQLKNSGVPIVLADRCIARKDQIDMVTAENYNSTYSCMRHLHQNGFQKVAFFTPGNSRISPRLIRHQAFMDAMAKLYHLDGSLYTFETGVDSIQGNEEQLSRFLEQNRGEKLAIFCVNGVALIHALIAMQRIGCFIGDSMGICGFDDWEWASLIPPGITTIAKDSYAIGMESAKILLKRISSRRDVKPVFVELEGKLCIRGSTDSELARKFPGWSEHV